VNKATGEIGGNSHGGPIYGELTQGAFQNVIYYMMVYAGLSDKCRFIDVGCGLGKPSLHTALQTGVEFSYGLEVERVRYYLGMNNLLRALEAAEDKLRLSACFFALGNIQEVNILDPFTHVYMFDVG
jgi:hypothetical protein